MKLSEIGRINVEGEEMFLSGVVIGHLLMRSLVILIGKMNFYFKLCVGYYGKI